jgi:hypothetical protein
LIFTDELLNTIARNDAYFFLDRYSTYHQISITPKYIYKITFVTDWRAFTWVVMSFGVKEGPFSY